MVTVALTGGIATGKSHVLERFRGRGVACLDADELAHGVDRGRHRGDAGDRRRFGADVLDPDGAVDRRKLGPLVFADAAARRDLEAIVHPAVYRAIAAGLRAFELTGSRARHRRHPAAVRDDRTRGDFDACDRDGLLAGVAAGAADGAGIVRNRRASAPGGADAGGRESGARRLRHPDRRHVRGNGRAGPVDLVRSSNRLLRPRLRSGPGPARSALRRTCSSRGSAGTATAARCCDSGSACRRADRDRTRRARSDRRSDSTSAAGCRSCPSARQIAWWMLSACGFWTSAANSRSSASCGCPARGEMA